MKTRNDHSHEARLRELLEGKENPFVVPAGYFETLPGEINKQLEAIPAFDRTAASHPFTVPENYFTNLPVAISNKIARSKEARLATPWSDLLRPRIAIPLALAAVLVIAFFLFKGQNHVESTPERQLTIDDLKNSYYLQTIDEDLLVDVLASQKVSSRDESIEQYLIDNDIEVSQLAKEL